MTPATSTAAASATPPASARQAWTTFWQQPGQSRCVAGAPQVWQALGDHWSDVAATLESGARVLDLGCGAGAVGRLLVTARSDLHVTGIDFARVPLLLEPRVESLADTAMEALPFAEHCFAAVVSQFGFEYGDVDVAAREMARVLAPGGRVSLLVHHADSAIVRTNRERLGVLSGFLSPAMRAAFTTADAGALQGLLLGLRRKFPADLLMTELAHALPSRLARAPRERQAIWVALEDALAPERCLAESLEACCVSPDDIDSWLGALRAVCEVAPAGVLREADGVPVAWSVTGRRR